jgi:PAS domain-containing protein
MGSIFDFLKDLIPWAKIKIFLHQLYSHQPYALLGAGLLLIVSVGLGWVYWHRSSEYEEIVRNTLWSNMEATPQRYKGLEAFVFSTLKQTSDVDVSDELRREQLHSDFLNACSRLQSRLDDYWKHEQELTSQVRVRVAKGKNEGKILTDDIRPGFLFLPVFLLRPSFASSDIDRLASPYLDENSKAQLIEPAIKADAELRKDIALTGFLAHELQELTTTAVIEPLSPKLKTLLKNTPTQVYVISKNGINRIFKSGPADVESYYGTQFSATTFFPSRPYFWPAFLNTETEDKNAPHQHWNSALDPGSDERSVGKFFYVSRPYLDLAGNGIVVTLARGLLIEGKIQAVVCFDLPYITSSNNVYDILRNQIIRYEGDIVPVVCDMTPGKDPECKKDSDIDNSPVKDSEKPLVDYIGQYIRNHSVPRERSEIAGNLQVFEDSAGAGAMHFSVPIEALFSGEQQKARLALVKLDFIEYQRKTSLFAAASSGSFALMIVWLTYLWGATVRSKKEYQEAFGEVAKVMYKSPTPYLRLDSHDKIVDCSLSFCKMLGYPADQDSVKQLQSHTFRSFCADEKSVQRYKEVQNLRKENRPVDPYKLNLKGKDEIVVKVIVRSATVPAPSKGRFPETFGILLQQEDVTARPKEPTQQIGGTSNLRPFRR